MKNEVLFITKMKGANYHDLKNNIMHPPAYAFKLLSNPSRVRGFAERIKIEFQL